MNNVMRKFMIGSINFDHWRKVDSTLDNFISIRNFFQSHLEYLSEEMIELPDIVQKIVSVDLSNIASLTKSFKFTFEF